MTGLIVKSASDWLFNFEVRWEFSDMSFFRYIMLAGLIVCSTTLGQQNDKEIIQLWKLAAEQGNATAQYNLGVAYDNGRGVAKSHQEAAKWYRLAADQ